MVQPRLRGHEQPLQRVELADAKHLFGVEHFFGRRPSPFADAGDPVDAVVASYNEHERRSPGSYLVSS
ncbi:hypothetical protein [Haladaptatus halobius]|uniref:hypothetical protein n=1 Tax=Haladaptatus halobius TaxID=2884875 RepID=UPI001D0A5BFB|nr:hypothetical protein [Haladaptatus halobius]